MLVIALGEREKVKKGWDEVVGKAYDVDIIYG